MNKTMIAVTTGVVSLGIGGVVGYLLAEKRVSEKYAKQADEEVAKIRDRYRENYRDLKDKVSEDRRQTQEAKDYLNDTVDKVREKYDVDNVYDEVDEPPHKRVRYDKIVEDENYIEGEEEEEFTVSDENPSVEIPKVDPNRLEPFLVSDEDYWVNERDHSQSTLVYYINDDVLVDETDQVIADEADIVGDSLSVFDKNRDLTVVYVRNNRLRADMEIVIDNDPYEGEF